MKTRFLNQNGYERERERAAKVFDTTREYTITGGEVGRSYSNYTFAEVEGSWNTVMFDVGWEQVEHLLSNPYAKFQ